MLDDDDDVAVFDPDDDWYDDDDMYYQEPGCMVCCDSGAVRRWGIRRRLLGYSRACPCCYPTRLDRLRSWWTWQARPRLRHPFRRRVAVIYDDEAPF